MIVIATISMLPGELSTDAAAAIEPLSECEPRRGVRIRLPLDDPGCQLALRILNDAGMSPWRSATGPRKKGREYSFRLERRYSSTDLASCSLLELRPPAEACNHEAIFRTVAGEMIVPEAQTPSGFDIMTGDSFWYFTPSRIKELLESSGLINLRFRPTAHVPQFAGFELNGTPVECVPELDSFIRSGRRLDDPVSYWEIDTDFTLPPLSPSMSFVDSEGNSVESGDFANGFDRRDGFYTNPELHHRASDLADLPPFDLARTFEPFTFRRASDWFDRPLVASRRFYRFCVQNGLRTGWLPVRFEPG